MPPRLWNWQPAVVLRVSKERQAWQTALWRRKDKDAHDSRVEVALRQKVQT